jgi:hypothetical protein
MGSYIILHYTAANKITDGQGYHPMLNHSHPIAFQTIESFFLKIVFWDLANQI